MCHLIVAKRHTSWCGANPHSMSDFLFSFCTVGFVQQALVRYDPLDVDYIRRYLRGASYLRISSKMGHFTLFKGNTCGASFTP